MTAIIHDLCTTCGKAFTDDDPKIDKYAKHRACLYRHEYQKAVERLRVDDGIAAPISARDAAKMERSRQKKRERAPRPVKHCITCDRQVRTTDSIPICRKCKGTVSAVDGLTTTQRECIARGCVCEAHDGVGICGAMLGITSIPLGDCQVRWTEEVLAAKFRAAEMGITNA